MHTCLPCPCFAPQDYLETKRIAFPRFYFVAPADLLDILSKGSNPQLILRHLSKCFDNVHNLSFRRDERGEPTKVRWLGPVLVQFCTPGRKPALVGNRSESGRPNQENSECAPLTKTTLRMCGSHTLPCCKSKLTITRCLPQVVYYTQSKLYSHS
jgi:hypothetical protein